MKGPVRYKRLVLFFIFSLLFSGTVFPQPRYFDAAVQNSDSIRLTVFYPSMGSIRALMALRNRGIFRVDSLVVVGVYYEKERTNYQPSINYASENYIDWLKFHQLSGDLNKERIFEQNDLSDDFEMIFEKSDGIIFFGGADIPPYIYHQKTSLLSRIATPYRSLLETSIIFHLLGGSQNKTFKPLLDDHPEFPILGICLGCQSLNIGTGGTLIQDIWSQIYHKKTYEDVIALRKECWHTNPWSRLYPEEKLIPYNMHHIRLSKKGKFVKELNMNQNDMPVVISAHHQMAGKLGRELRVIATSLDGKVVEALEHERYPNVLGVQFHPEFPILYNRNKTYRFTPQDTAAISLVEILEHNPPSYEFHRKIWQWFGDKLRHYHNSKK